MVDLQITPRNDLSVQEDDRLHLEGWIQAYFDYEVTTVESSQKVQLRDIKLFAQFLKSETGNDLLKDWSPRLSKAYVTHLRKTLNDDGTRRWNDRTINRILAHLKTLSKWIHGLSPFPLGNPMAKVKTIKTASLLDIERAITDQERRRILDAADHLINVGGLSKDRNRFPKQDQRPQRKNYRPWRNRAIIYTLIETGMRRSAVCSIDLGGLDNRKIKVVEKGEVENIYSISKPGLEAIQDYIQHEREGDYETLQSPALFLPAASCANSEGRLTGQTINNIWNANCKVAEVDSKTPHSARHAMGRHLMEKTGNLSAVQKQLNHQNASYTMQYTRITREELNDALDERD